MKKRVRLVNCKIKTKFLKPIASRYAIMRNVSTIPSTRYAIQPPVVNPIEDLSDIECDAILFDGEEIDLDY